MERYAVSTPHAPSSDGASSQAIAHNGVLYVSSQLPLDPVTGVMLPRPIVRGTEAAFRAQVLQCLANLRAVCEAAGAEMTDALKLTFSTTVLAHAPVINSVCRETFPHEPPAQSLVGVSSLPGDAYVVVDAIVALR